MKHVAIWAFLAMVAGCAGGGTETDNPASPLKDFTASGCKNREPTGNPQALVLASDADGLQCVEWETNGSGTLTLRLLNFPEPCGNAYLGSAAQAADGALELSVHKDTCAALKCGLCVFDFEYELSGIASDAPLPLRLGSAACASEPATFSDELTLPLPEQPNGILCRYLERSALEWYSRGRSSCSQRNMPCGACDSADQTTCNDGLACSAIADGDSRCLQTCAGDEDCRGGLGSCTDGVCQVSAGF